MKLFLKVFFLPTIVLGVTLFSVYATSELGLKNAYIPNIIIMFSLLGTIERVLGRLVSDQKEFGNNFLFVLLNPVLMPVVWYLLFFPLFHLRLDPLEAISNMPLWAQTALVFLGAELFRYWAHRLQHELPSLWRFHAVHHSIKRLHTFNQYVSHPVDYFIRNSLTYTPFVMFAFDPMAVVIARAMNVSITMNGHVDLGIKHGAWNYIFPTFDLHKWHHSKIPSEANNNYGISICLWDHVFGTFFYPKDREVLEHGIEDERYGTHELMPLLKAPFKKGT